MKTLFIMCHPSREPAGDWYMFQIACHQRLLSARRDQVDVIHFFENWPPRISWPSRCEARATEMVVYGDIRRALAAYSEAKTKIRDGLVIVAGMTERKNANTLRKEADLLGLNIDMDGYAFACARHTLGKLHGAF